MRKFGIRNEFTHGKLRWLPIRIRWGELPLFRKQHSMVILTLNDRFTIETVLRQGPRKQ